MAEKDAESWTLSFLMAEEFGKYKSNFQVTAVSFT
jgi:hypothetical protein